MKASVWDQVTEVESLGDELSIIEPEGTPFVSMVAKTRATQVLHTEFADKLRPARRTGTRAGKGVTGGGDKTSGRRAITSRVHRVFDEWAVDDVETDVAKAGGNAVTTDQAELSRMKCLRELKRDMEAICLGDQDSSGSADKEMVTRGFFSWVSPTAQTDLPVPDDYRPAAAQVLTLGTDKLTETTTSSGFQSFNGLAKELHKRYGTRVEAEIFAGVNICEAFDLFSRTSQGGDARYNVNENASNHTITLHVSVFESTFIRGTIIPDHFLRVDANGVGNANSAAVVVPEFFNLAFLESPASKDLEDDGGGPHGWIRAKFALMCRNPRGQAAIM